ncbi:Olfactory receptor 4Q2 [Liparis tanakae]|uniref:Olfactory receptor 4Q2 n=1 Tax=Liparis tanakae TaxID=230148 RepID=A0A4Z2I567_9TELE|nr:Olfactory receptor 4Q2 [Liparis tanakae]
MESNMTSNILKIQGFNISPEFIYPLFFFLLFVYSTLLCTNIGLLVLIVTDKTLHQPMYVLFCNLSINDVLGNTALLPQLMAHIISTERLITYNQCVTQAFYSHTFGTAAHLILIIMAIDRYVAICHPLRYNSIMTTKAVIVLSAIAWAISLVLVAVLIGLTHLPLHILYQVSQVSALQGVQDVQLVTVVGPGAVREPALLSVEGEEGHVHSAGALCDCGGIPHNLAIMPDHHIGVHGASEVDAKSHCWKVRFLLLNVSFCAFAGFFYWKHTMYCESGSYTLFALFEYLVVFSNMAFHLTAVWDFKSREVMVISTSEDKDF